MDVDKTKEEEEAAKKAKELADAKETKITLDMLPTINPDDLINPPPDIKSIIEVTVSYVVRNGLSFEGELRKRQQSSRKFDFLITGNPYYKWYKWKLACAIDPKAAEEAKKLAEKEKAEEDELMNQKEKEAELAKQSVKVVELTLKQKIEQEMKLLKKVKDEFKDLVPEPKYYVPLPSHMTTQDVDLIKLTAQFVARNGRTFLNALSSQAQSAQGTLSQRYLFLNPIDPRFPYFQKLVQAYNECIVVQQETRDQLARDMSFDRLYQEALGAAEMTVIEERKRKQLDQDLQNVTNEVKLIDWQDFTVVETITFDEENEYYPAPGASISDINNILDMEKRKEINVVLAEDVQEDMEIDMDVDNRESSDEELVESRPATQVRQIAPPPAKKPKDDTIRTANLDQEITLETPENKKLREMLEAELLKTSAAPTGTEKFTKCPVTGVMVETQNLSEHIRISLLDPKWKQQKDALISRLQVSSLAEDTDIVSNLSNFQRKHSKQMGYDRGQTMTEGKLAPADAARIKEAQEQQRLRKAAAAGLSGGQAPKRRKLESLLPEDQFMSSHRESQGIKVKVPRGGEVSTLDFNIPVTMTIGELKANIQRTLGQSGNFSITSGDLGTLEEERTLAYYNLAAGADLTFAAS